MELDEVLRQCVVKVIRGRDAGTGFFVGPRLIATCAHVVRNAENLEVYWNRCSYAPTDVCIREDGPDVAMITIDIESHPWVAMGESIAIGDRTYGFGFSDQYPQGDSVTLEYEGPTDDAEPLLKFKEGQVRPGLSGSPLLSLRTGSVVGMIKTSRDRGSSLGGRAVGAGRLIDFARKMDPEFSPDTHELWHAARGGTDLEFLELATDRVAKPPRLYAPSPYSLLQDELAGRDDELRWLTDWALNLSETFDNPIQFVLGIGGIGKSAAAWTWLQAQASADMPHFASFFWWSFYEEESQFEKCLIHLLAYVTGKSPNTILKLPRVERERRLLVALSERPYLVVLDGMERLLVAYTKYDVDLMDDAAEQVLGVWHAGRHFSDPRAAVFLRKLAQTCASRVLALSRLFPSELQTVAGKPARGIDARVMSGLDERGALALWNSFDVTGDRNALARFSEKCRGFPLVIRIIAGQIAHDRSAPGDFDAWLSANPEFDPFDIPLVNVHTHVLRYALSQLPARARETLETLSIFRWPAKWLAVRSVVQEKLRAVSTEGELDEALSRLEERGLVGWNKEGNQYEVHGVVKRVVLQSLDASKSLAMYKSVADYLQSVAGVHLTGLEQFALFHLDDEWDDTDRFDQLHDRIELFLAKVRTGDLPDAITLFRRKLENSLRFRHGCYQQVIECLEAVIEVTEEGPVPKCDEAVGLVELLSEAYAHAGLPSKAVNMYAKLHRSGDLSNVGLHLFSRALLSTGRIPDAELVAQQAIGRSRLRRLFLMQRDYSGFQMFGDGFTATQVEAYFPEAQSLQELGAILAYSGAEYASRLIMDQCFELISDLKQPSMEGLTNGTAAECCVAVGQFTKAVEHARKASKLADVQGVVPHKVKALRLLAEAELKLGNQQVAQGTIEECLELCRQCEIREEEWQAQRILAGLNCSENEASRAVELLRESLQYALSGGFLLLAAQVLQDAKTYGVLDSVCNEPELSLQHLVESDLPSTVRRVSEDLNTESLSVGDSPDERVQFSHYHEQAMLLEHEVISSIVENSDPPSPAEWLSADQVTSSAWIGAATREELRQIEQLYRNAVEALQGNDVEKAKPFLEQLADHCPHFPRCREFLAMCFQAQGALEASIAGFESAVDRQPFDADSRLAVASLRSQFFQESDRELIDQLYAASLVAPHRCELMSIVVDAYVEREEFEEAEAFVSRYSSQQVNYMEASLESAMIAIQRGENEVALKRIELVEQSQEEFVWNSIPAGTINFVRAAAETGLSKKRAAKKSLASALEEAESVESKTDADAEYKKLRTTIMRCMQADTRAGAGEFGEPMGQLDLAQRVHLGRILAVCLAVNKDSPKLVAIQRALNPS